MFKQRNQLVAPARLITLVLGGAITIFITKKLIDVFGIANYSRYSIMTSIPALIPFADLGLGLSVFNIYAKLGSEVPLNRASKEKISLAFYLICAFSVLGIITFYLFISNQFRMHIFGIELDTISNTKSLVIVSLTFMSAPLTLGFKKMYAYGNVLKAILFGFFIPLANLMITLILISNGKGIDGWIIYAPSVSYLVVNFSAFVNGKVYLDIIKINFSFIKRQSGSMLKFAMYATYFSSLIAVTLQMPKYYFAHFNLHMDVAKYSVLLLFGASVGSLVSAHASIYVPDYKKYGNTFQIRRNILPNVRQAVSLSLLVILAYIAAPRVLAHIFRINFNDLDILSSAITILIYLLWVFYNSFVTEVNDLKVLLLTGFLSSVISYLILFLFEVRSYSIGIILITGQFFFVLLLTSLIRLFQFKGKRYE